MQSDRRYRAQERPTGAILLAWAVLATILLAINAGRIAAGQHVDPDDVLRLVQVRDLLAGQSWFDVTQYRIDPPQGVAMHWSRLVDIPLLIVIGILRPAIGQGAAEIVASAAIPLLILLGTLLVIGRIAWRLFDRQTAVLACLCTALVPAVIYQMQPMRIDHHGWQVFAVIFAVWAIMWRTPVKGGAAAGLAMAAGLIVSIELLPMAAAFGGVLGLRWLRDRRERFWLVGYMQALALGMTVLFFATRGIGSIAAYCDAVAPAHLGFFIIAAIGTTGIAAMPPVPRGALIGFFLIAGAAGLAFFAASAPQCLASPFGSLDPVVQQYWYRNIAEGRPIWEQSVQAALIATIQMIAALATVLVLMGRSNDWLRRWWLEYALLLGAAMLAAMFTFRSVAFAAVIAALPLGWLAGRMLRRLRTANRAGPKLAMAGMICLVLLPAAPVSLAAMLLPGQARANGTPAAEPVTLAQSSCDLDAGARAMANLPRGRVFAPLDIGPAILAHTNHAVIATAHHRADDAIRDTILAFSAPPQAAREIVTRDHGAQYLAICTDVIEPAVYAARGGEESLAARLIAGDPPAWLEPVDPGTAPALAVYRVR
jgi:hypothetical protein